jgi:hypothetical protein
MVTSKNWKKKKIKRKKKPLLVVPMVKTSHGEKELFLGGFLLLKRLSIYYCPYLNTCDPKN